MRNLMWDRPFLSDIILRHPLFTRQQAAEQRHTRFLATTMSEAATVKCAPSKNLNAGFTHFATAKEMYAHL